MEIYNIYLISAEINDQMLYKIGFTKRKVEKRIKEFTTGNASNFEIVHIFECKKYQHRLEKRLHSKFKKSKIKGEWFKLNNDDINSFLKTCQTIWDELDYIQKNNLYLSEKNIIIK